MKNTKDIYIVPKHLYEYAYRFLDASPWENISEEQAFALRADDGQIIYVQIIGSNNPTDKAIYIFTSEEAFTNLRSFYELPEDTPYHTLTEATINVHGIHLAFRDSTRVSIPEEIISSARNYLEENDPDRLNDERIPYFQNKMPYQSSLIFDGNDKNADYLIQAIQATIALEQMIEEGKLFLPSAYLKNGYLIEKTGEGYQPVEYIEFPEKNNQEDNYYTIPVSDEEIEELKKLPREGEIDLELTVIPDPKIVTTIDEETGADIFHYEPFLVIKNDELKEGLVTIVLHRDTNHRASDLENILKSLTIKGKRPKKIYVQNTKSATFIEEIAYKLDIEVIFKESLDIINMMLAYVHQNK